MAWCSWVTTRVGRGHASHALSMCHSAWRSRPCFLTVSVPRNSECSWSQSTAHEDLRIPAVQVKSWATRTWRQGMKVERSWTNCPRGESGSLRDQQWVSGQDQPAHESRTNSHHVNKVWCTSYSIHQTVTMAQLLPARFVFLIWSANFFTIRAQGLRSTYLNQLALQCETQFSFDRTGKFHTRDSGIESVIF